MFIKFIFFALTILWHLDQCKTGQGTMVKLGHIFSHILDGSSSPHGTSPKILSVSHHSTVCPIFNRPGVFGAVLQTPLSFIN